MQIQRDIVRKNSVDQEHVLLDLTNRLASNWCAVHIHLSRISAVKRNENIVFALQMFEAAVRGLDGRRLVMRNGDWIYLYPDNRAAAVNTAVGRLRRLFAGDQLYYNEEKYEADFATWYALATDRSAIRELAQRLAGANGAPTEKPAVAEPTPIRIPNRTAELIAMSQTLDAIERANLAAFLRRQPICAYPFGGEIDWLFDEFYFSIVDLEVSLNRSPILTGDPIFLQYVARCLDTKLLPLLRPACLGSDNARLSLNLNVSSVITPEFTEFDMAIPAEVKRTIAIEFQFIDVFSDLGIFLYVRGLLRERGYQVFLDGLTETNLPFVEPRRLGVDLLKVRWSPTALAELRSAIQATAPETVVLCRCDSEAAINFGHSAGVHLFQGRYVTELLQIRHEEPAAQKVFASRQ